VGESIPTPATFNDDYSTRSSAAQMARMTIAEDVTELDYKLPIPPGLTPQEGKEFKQQSWQFLILPECPTGPPGTLSRRRPRCSSISSNGLTGPLAIGFEPDSRAWWGCGFHCFFIFPSGNQRFVQELPDSFDYEAGLVVLQEMSCRGNS